MTCWHRFNYLITGCGHSGTGYAAKLLTSVGIPCGHEAYEAGIDEINLSRCPDERPPVADSNWRAWQNIHLDVYSEAKIIHLVRNPLHFVRSYAEPYHELRGTPAWDRKLLYYMERWVTINNSVALWTDALVAIESCPVGLLIAVDKIPYRGEIFDDPTYNRHYKGELELSFRDLRDAVARRDMHYLWQAFRDAVVAYGYRTEFEQAF